MYRGKSQEVSGAIAPSAPTPTTPLLKRTMDTKGDDAMGRVNPAMEVDEELGLNEKLDKGVTPVPVVVADDHFTPTDQELNSDVQDESIITFEDLPVKNDDKTGVIPWARIKSAVVTPMVEFCTKHKRAIRILKLATLFSLFTWFIVGAIIYHVHYERTFHWDRGLGLLVLLSIFVYSYLLYALVIRRAWRWFFGSTKIGQKFTKKVVTPVLDKYTEVSEKRYFTPAAIGALVLVFITFVAVDSMGDIKKMQSALGIIVLVLLGALFSKHPDRINWRTIMWGLVLQYIMGILILRWPVGRALVKILGDQVKELLDYTKAGSGFVYGSLVNQVPFNSNAVSNDTVAHEVMTQINRSLAFKDVFAFSILSVVIFFSFIVSMLFHLGAMQWLIMKIGWVLKVTMGTTPCESLTASANIFIGQTEAPLMIKPFLGKMTPSELHSVMTGGFATISGSVLAAYINFDAPAEQLLTASVMSAPAALACAKLLLPETKKTKATLTDISGLKSKSANLLDAASQGASSAVFLVLNIIGGLIAMMAFVAFVNGILAFIGHLFSDPNSQETLTLELIFGYLFYPLAWLLGVDNNDLRKVGQLIGVKTTINEFVAYSQLKTIRSGMSERSATLATYALCGFSNLASLGIQTAALGAMAPERAQDISRVAIRAFVAGSMACFLTACVAGTLIA